MTSEKKGVFAVQSSSISRSAPNTPLTKTSKAFLDHTLIPQIQSPVWKTGVPTPSLDGTLTSNQEGINLLAGFATGSVRMEGDIVQHLPATQGTPLTKTSKAFLDHTLIPQIQSPVWKTGVPTPSLDGTLTSNQEGINLLAGFATGSVRMEGDIVQHLPATQGNKAIGESLS